MAKVKVRAEISGSVWKIEKQPGDSVDEDEAIIILESMKMEIPVSSPASGTVASVLVAEGDTVEEDQVVAEIET